MTDADREAGLLQAIVENPADDTPRLILADLYDDTGREARAEFIRVQCELANHDRAIAEGKQDSDIMKWVRLRDSERELLAIEPSGYYESDPNKAKGWCGGSVAIHWGLMAFASLRDSGLLYEDRLQWTFRRGFVAEVSCTCADWLAHGDRVVRLQPIEEVTLTDKQPRRFGHLPDCFGWFLPASTRGQSQDELPGRLFSLVYPVERFPCFADEQAAQNALSRAAVSWARQQASLPALPGSRQTPVGSPPA